MIRNSGTAGWRSVAVAACLVGGLGTTLAACGGSTPSASKPTQVTTPHGRTLTVTVADQSVCTAVKQAYSDYQAKNYTKWRQDISALATKAGTVNNAHLKKYLREAREADKRPAKGTFNFSGIGAFLGLRKTCKQLGQ